MVDFLMDAGGFLGGETVIISDESYVNKSDILSESLFQSGISNDGEEDRKSVLDTPITPKHNSSWDTETDALLDSILTGNDEKFVLGLERPFSDTSSDSGCNLLSPSGASPEHRPSSNPALDLIGYLSNEDDEVPLQAVNPVTFDEDEELISAAVTATTTNNTSNNPLQSGGQTTIVMPMMNSVRQTIDLNETNNNKRRRISISSSNSSSTSDTLVPLPKTSSNTIVKIVGGGSTGNQKYPALILNAEEERLCEREGIKLPSHYPLSREEEKNLKRIRRKIRNKESAQNSRKRKKEYVDNMEDRVKLCTNENEELKSRIATLEKQNKTLAGQLRRLHQIIVNGGGIRQNQTSTAMMVLLLSTALFLLPGFQSKQNGDNKPELDIPSVVKQLPPMPGSSRSLLHFPSNNIKQEYTPSAPMTPSDIPAEVEVDEVIVETSSMMMEPTAPSVVTIKQKQEQSSSILGKRPIPHTDHDYLLSSNNIGNGLIMAPRIKKSYIDDDVPPRGYGPGVVIQQQRNVVQERKMNVNVSHSGSVRTVVLHVPQDIQ